MSTVNFNDTVPAPPANFANLKWQSDASGNISAYDPVGTWTSWTPGAAATGSMTATISGTPTAKYLRFGPLVFLEISIALVVGGTASNGLTVTNLPFSAPSVSALTCYMDAAGAGTYVGAGYCFALGTGVATYRDGYANYTVGTTVSLTITGFYVP